MRGPIEVALAVLRRDPQFSQLMVADYQAKFRDDGVALRRKDLISDDRLWYASAECQLTGRGYGTDHVMQCFRAMPSAAMGESCGITLLRAEGRRDFLARDRSLTREAIAAVAPLIGAPLARFRDPSPADLSPRVREVLACLLEGDSDKLVASRLNLSKQTVNQDAKIIFKHFCVRGRGELEGRWIRRQWGSPFPWVE